MSSDAKFTKAYTAPRLEHFGSLAELSAGGSGLQLEGSMTGGGPMTGFPSGNPSKQRL